MKIAIANDHGGLDLKNAIMKHYKGKYDFINCGTDTYDSCDYPLFAFKACELVASKKADFAIVICLSVFRNVTHYKHWSSFIIL